MELSYSLNTYPGITLREPLTFEELVERIYREGRRICGFVTVDIDVLCAAPGMDAAHGVIAERFLGESSSYATELRYWPCDRSNPNRLVLFVEVLVAADHLDVDWDRIEGGRPDTVSRHNYAARPVEL